jgi:hypothetical protein
MPVARAGAIAPDFPMVNKNFNPSHAGNEGDPPGPRSTAASEARPTMQPSPRRHARERRACTRRRCRQRSLPAQHHFQRPGVRGTAERVVRVEELVQAEPVRDEPAGVDLLRGDQPEQRRGRVRVDEAPSWMPGFGTSSQVLMPGPWYTSARIAIASLLWSLPRSSP